MSTRSVRLTQEQDAFISEVVKSGEYRSASETVREAINALQRQRADDAEKSDQLRAELKAGIDALDAGNYDEVEAAETDGYLDRLSPPSRQ